MEPVWAVYTGWKMAFCVEEQKGMYLPLRQVIGSLRLRVLLQRLSARGPPCLSGY